MKRTFKRIVQSMQNHESPYAKILSGELSTDPKDE